jgi:hypothetical protein
MDTCHTPSRLMSRKEAANFLRANGVHTTPHGLACHAARGTGPRFSRFGRSALYRENDLLEWIERGLTPPAASSAAHKAARRAGRGAGGLGTNPQN